MEGRKSERAYRLRARYAYEQNTESSEANYSEAVSSELLGCVRWAERDQEREFLSEAGGASSGAMSIPTFMAMT